ncbi:hypothetical protein JL108_14215 [Aeromicrobium sp. YIM 150415]|uniref:hypothetical protein n=1 Tax=Aeromicrobium sp. YIM 150415 TaxID=2803912 RepID=UPI001966A5DD|nr:hypothetical protein [Aeromicrobium sp. YIM 150415]MBM9464608.1 hypothetical protein [Aeromicrobium sp. YIM 150415]
MGLFDKVKGALAGPDHSPVLREQLGDDQYLAHVVVIASASEPDRPSKAPRDVVDLAQKGAHHLIDRFVENRHIGGEEGTVAGSLPRGSEPLVLALAEGSVTLWRFGLGAKKTSPDLVARIPREDITSIADTGKRTARGHLRLSFTDGSFFDQQTVATPSEEFWQAADAYGAS